MAGKAAYKALIKSTSVSPVATIMEAFVAAPSNLQIGATSYFSYRVANPLKRIMSRSLGLESSDPSLFDDVFQVDWLAGIVHFTSSKGAGFDANFSFYTSAEVVGANSYTLDIGGDVLTDTSFKSARENGGNQTRVLGLHDVSFSIDRFSDYGKIFLEYKRNRSRVLIEVTPGGEDCGPYGGTYRGWFVVETDGFSGDVGDLESESISFNLAGEFEEAFTFIPWEA